MTADSSINSIYVLTHYHTEGIPCVGSKIEAYDERIFLSFMDAYDSIKKRKIQTDELIREAEKTKTRLRSEDFDFTWASRLERYDLSRGGPSQAEWMFDYRGELFTATEPPPSCELLFSSGNWDCLPNTIVAVEYLRYFHLGVVQSINGSDCEIELPICDQDGLFKIIRRPKTHLLPYHQGVLQPHIKFRLEILLARQDLGIKLKSRTRVVQKQNWLQQPEAALTELPSLYRGLRTVYNLTKYTCDTPTKELAAVDQHTLGIFSTAEQARDAMLQDISRKTDQKSTLRYCLSSSVLITTENGSIDTRWNGDWMFDEQGRCLGWFEMNSRPFLGRPPEDRAFHIGDLVSVIDHSRSLMPGLVIGVPRAPDKAFKGMDSSDDRYFVSGIRHHRSGNIDFDDFNEGSIMPLMSELTDDQIMTLAGQLIDDSESDSYGKQLKTAPLIPVPEGESTS